MVPAAAAAPSFLFQNINNISEEELDSLPYGVIQLDVAGNVMRYNSYEANLAGLTKQKVVGKNFFEQVAPCTEVREFYGKFEKGVAAGQMHTTFRFHFAFKKDSRDVTVTLFYNQRDETVWVLVQPFAFKK
jgi:photoactive yellow protein